MVQLPPLDVSARLLVTPEPFSKLPTATHAWSTGHDTAVSVPPEAPTGRGVDSVVQRSPLMVSASGWGATGSPAMYPPTASHDVGAEQDTPSSWLLAAPDGSWVVVVAQVFPSHVSDSVRLSEEASAPCPTVTHELVDVHETPSNLLTGSPAGSADVSTAQEVPS
jgi:hypothetical protein